MNLYKKTSHRVLKYLNVKYYRSLLIETIIITLELLIITNLNLIKTLIISSILIEIKDINILVHIVIIRNMINIIDCRGLIIGIRVVKVILVSYNEETLIPTDKLIIKLFT